MANVWKFLLNKLNTQIFFCGSLARAMFRHLSFVWETGPDRISVLLEFYPERRAEDQAKNEERNLQPRSGPVRMVSLITDHQHQSPGHVTVSLFSPLYATVDIVPLSQIERLSTALKNLLRLKYATITASTPFKLNTNATSINGHSSATATGYPSGFRSVRYLLCFAASVRTGLKDPCFFFALLSVLFSMSMHGLLILVSCY